MKRLTLMLLALGLIMVVLTSLVAARTTRDAAIRTLAARAAIAFDMSPALDSIEQFIPEKSVVIHPAVESPPQRQGAMEGPGTGLRATPPSPAETRAAGRGNVRAREGGPRPIPPRPPAPEINAAGAAVEQTTQGKRAALETLASFDALGDGFAGHVFPPGGGAADANEGRGGGGPGGIDISLAVGPDHVFEILNGNLAVFTKKGKQYDSTGKLLYGAVPNHTVFAGFGVRCGVSNNADSVVRYDQLAHRWLIVLPIFTRPPGNPEGPYAMCRPALRGAHGERL